MSMKVMNVKARSAFPPRLLYGAMILVSVSIMSILAVHQGAYYDDEIFSIESASSHNYTSLWHFINTADVHPPGAYIINKFLFDIFGSWEAVKILGGITNAVALAVFGMLAYDHLGSRARWALGLLLMASGTHVMWGASVRWYAYFNPIFTVALGFILFSGISYTKRAMILGVSIVSMFYISYAALCAAPVLLVAHLLREGRSLGRRDLGVLVAVGSVCFLICVPQLSTLLQVQIHNRDGQTGSFASALSQTAMTLLVGNAVFPIAVVPIIYALSIAGLATYFLFFKPKSSLDWTISASLAIGIVAMVATGIGIKPRNSVFLLPLFFLVVASALDRLRPTVSYGLVALIAMFQLLGAANVVAHRGTIKGTYDSDYPAAMASITQWKSQCEGKLVVFHHDVVLGHLLGGAAITQSSPYAPKPQGKIVDLADGDCVVFVKTYRGTFDQATLSTHYRAMETAGLRQVATKSLGEDKNAAAKSWIGKEAFPQYLIVLRKDVAATHVALPAWDFPCPGCSGGDRG